MEEEDNEASRPPKEEEDLSSCTPLDANLPRRERMKPTCQGERKLDGAFKIQSKREEREVDERGDREERGWLVEGLFTVWN